MSRVTVAVLYRVMLGRFEDVLQRLDAIDSRLTQMGEQSMSNADAFQQDVVNLTDEVGGMRTDLQVARDKIDAEIASLKQQNPTLDLSGLEAAVATLRQERQDVQGFDPNNPTGNNAPGNGEQPTTQPAGPTPAPSAPATPSDQGNVTGP